MQHVVSRAHVAEVRVLFLLRNSDDDAGLVDVSKHLEPVLVERDGRPFQLTREVAMRIHPRRVDERLVAVLERPEQDAVQVCVGLILPPPVFCGTCFGFTMSYHSGGSQRVRQLMNFESLAAVETHDAS